MLAAKIIIFTSFQTWFHAEIKLFQTPVPAVGGPY